MAAARQRGDVAAAIWQVQKREGRGANSQDDEWGINHWKAYILVFPCSATIQVHWHVLPSRYSTVKGR